MTCKCNGDNQFPSQRNLSAFIQDNGCGPLSRLIPAVANGSGFGEGLRVTGSAINLGGESTSLYTPDEHGKPSKYGESRNSTTTGGTINLEWARSGCGGRSVAEFQDRKFDIVIGEFHSGDSRLEPSNASNLLRFCGVNPTSIAHGGLTSFDADDNERLIISQSATVEGFIRTYGLGFREIVHGSEFASTSGGVEAIAVLSSADSSRLSRQSSNCGEFFFALRRDGTILYLANITSQEREISQTESSLPGDFRDATMVYHSSHLFIVNNNQIYIVPVGSEDSPGTLVMPLMTEVLTVNPGVSIRRIKICDGRVIVYGGAGNSSSILEVAQNGEITPIYSANDLSYQIIDLDCCGDDYAVVGSNGFNGIGDFCKSTLADTFLSGGASTGTAVAYRVPGEIWYGDDAGRIYWTNTNNSTRELSLSVENHVIRGITWSSPCIGYILAHLPNGPGSRTRVYTTVDGGATWQFRDRIDQEFLSTEIAHNRMAVPCCSNELSASNILYLALETGIWKATAEWC